MSQKDNYDNPALSTGLTIGEIVADYESQVIANRKKVFQNAMNAANFRIGVYQQLEAFNNANRELERKAFEELAIYASREIKRAYNDGIKRMDDNVKEYVKQGYNARDLRFDGKSNMLFAALTSTLATLAGTLQAGRQSANQQLLQITNLVNPSSDNLAQEIDAKQMLFLQRGLAGKTNRNGVSQEISSVAELSMRQDSQKTLLMAQGERSAEYGLYLVQISAHPSSCPLCSPWQSKVLIDDVYKDGKPDGQHEMLSTAISAGLFHYNCRHKYIIYIPGYSRDNIFDYDKASAKDTAKRYAIEQEQRYNERMIRKWKRCEQGAINDVERLNAQNRVRDWQMKQRALAKYAEQERIPFYRQYQREAIGGETKPTINKYNNDPNDVKYGLYNVENRLDNASTKEQKNKLLRSAIESGELNLKIEQGQQDKHILGTRNYNNEKAQGRNKSVLTYDKPQELVDRFAGTGDFLYNERLGKWQHTEVVDTHTIVGYTNRATDGKDSYTTKITIHYGHNGVHIVPTLRKIEGEDDNYEYML